MRIFDRLFRPKPIRPRDRWFEVDVDITWPPRRPGWMSEEIAPGVSRCPADPENDAA